MKIDVLVLCGGSANDLPKQTVELAEHFNVLIVSILMQNSEHFQMLIKQVKISILVLSQLVGIQDYFH